MFQNKVTVITGGANGIGKCIAEEFQKNGAHVCVIDQSEGDHYVERRRYAECATICQKIEQAVEDGKRGAQPVVAAPAAPVQEAPRPKFCPNCGAPYEGGKFCQNCGSKL